MELILWILLGLFLIIVVGQAIVIRGAIRQENIIGQVLKFLTGREIEEMKRRVVQIGLNGTSKYEVLCLINTMNGVQLGVYKDEDVWIPEDPYEDV